MAGLPGTSPRNADPRRGVSPKRLVTSVANSLGDLNQVNGITGLQMKTQNNIGARFLAIAEECGFFPPVGVKAVTDRISWYPLFLFCLF